MNWSRRMQLAIDYIEENLDGSIDLEDVAKIAFCSKYHFHRMFFAMVGLTFAEYIRRRRFTLAAVEIQNSSRKVVDVALAYGHESPNAFTRAFRNIHGMNPVDVRKSSVTLSSYSKARIPAAIGGGEKMEYKIVEKPAFRVIGKAKSFEYDKFFKEGPKFWKQYVSSPDYKKLYQRTNGRPGVISEAPLLSAYFPKEKSGKDEFLELFGLETGSGKAVSGLDIHTVPAATYAEFSCIYKDAVKANRYIYGEWFASTGYERDGNKPDIAAYFPIAFRPMGEMGIRWWIPVKTGKKQAQKAG